LIPDAMENYFNYFTEIEEYFWQKRGTALLVSTLDWALIDSWKQSQIPLQAVLKGIDRTFEKYDARKRKVRAVNSLAYCQQEVLAAAQEIQRNTTSAPAKDPFTREDLASYFLRNAAAVEQAAGRMDAGQRPESAATLRQIASSLRDLAALPPSAAALDLQELEQRLTVLEDKLFATLLAGAAEQELAEIRAELNRQLAPVRGKMTAEQVSLLEKQFLQRKLLERAVLPRLSLFYL
jgi:hypothetical protein